jgi:hypothetical protein
VAPYEVYSIIIEGYLHLVHVKVLLAFSGHTC